MKMIRQLLFLPLLLGAMISRAQNNPIIQDYIDKYKELAITEMQRTGVPAAIKLAQGIHETMAGTSDLVTRSNNHFGIKCKSNWTGESVSHDDDARGECFRKYPSAIDSYKDHSNFLRANSRYASLFELDPTDYARWANGLKKAGYATNPKYPTIIIKLIEDYHLQDYSLIALGRKSADDVFLAKNKVDITENNPEPKAAVIVEKVTEPVEVQATYPTSEFSINDTRVVFIRKGTPFLAVAQQYNISLSRIFEFNELKEAETASRDQLIYLQRKRRTGNEEYHIVKAGETLYDIAQVQGMRLESLMEYNWLRGDMKPAVGERLQLKEKANAMPKLASGNKLTDPSERKWTSN